MLLLAPACLLSFAAVGWLLLAGALLRGTKTACLLPSSTEAATTTELIIPCRHHARLRENLERFAAQRCGLLTTTFVTASADEDAALVASEIARALPHCRHVVAGAAVGRGQKNHNLLAALAAARTERDPDVVVLCDDDCQPAGPGWLARFVARALEREGEAAITTFRDVALGPDPSLGTSLYFLGSAFQRAGMGLTSRFVWGGGVALSRKLLDALDLERLWSVTVVDDISLSRALQRGGIRIVFAREDVLFERAPSLSVPEALAWMKRQAQFTQYYAANAFWTTFALAWITGLSPLAVFLGVLAKVPLLVATGGACLAAVSATALASVTTHGRGSNRRALLAALLWSPLAVVAGCFVLVLCRFTSRVVWGGRRYTMARDGTVVDVAMGSST